MHTAQQGFTLLDAIQRYIATTPRHPERIAGAALSASTVASREHYRMIKKAARRERPRTDKHASQRIEALVSGLASVTLKDCDVLASVLHCWLVASDALRTEIESFLHGAGLQSAPLECLLTVTPVAYWNAEQTEAITSRIPSHLSAASEDVALMIACLTGHMPLASIAFTQIPDNKKSCLMDMPTIEKPMIATLWQEWITFLHELPADAPEWLTVGEFISDVRSLVKLKEQQRHSTTARKALKTALDRVRTESASVLRYYKFSSFDEWQSDACSKDSLETVRLDASQLIDHCAEVHPILHAVAGDIDELEQKQQKVHSHFEVIRELYNRIDEALLSVPPSPPEYKPDVDNNVDESSSDIVDNGIVVSDIANSEVPLAELSVREYQPEEAETSLAAMPAANDNKFQATGDDGLVETVETLDANGTLKAKTLESDLPRDTDEQIAPKEPVEGHEVTATELLAEVDPALEYQDEQHQEPEEIFTADEVSSALELELLQAPVADSSEDLVWTLLSEDDLPGAYWLTQSIEQSGSAVRSVSSQLIKAIFGARLISSPSDPIAHELARIPLTEQPDSDDPIQPLLCLAASLRPSVIAPATGLAAWLQAPRGFPYLHTFVDAVQHFAALNIPLQPDDLAEITDEHNRVSRLGRSVEEICRWRAEALTQRHTFRRANAVWRELLSRDSAFNEILEAACNDQRAQVDAIQQQLEEWQSAEFISEQIDRLDEALHGRGRDSIEGNARRYLIRNMQHAAGLIQTWVELVRQDSRFVAESDWITTRVSELREQVRGLASDIWAALESNRLNCPTASDAAATKCFQVAFRQFVAMLGYSLPRWDVKAACVPITLPGMPPVMSLDEVLRSRLLPLAEIRLNDEMEPVEDDLQTLSELLAQEATRRRTLVQGLRQRISQQDYRFISLVHETEGNEDGLSSEYAQEHLVGSQVALAERIGATLEAVEQAVVDGLLAEQDRAVHIARLEGIDVESVLNFPSQYAVLKQVADELEEARQKRLAHLKLLWDQLHPEVTVRFKSESADRISQRVTNALDHGDTRLLDEYLAHIRNSLDTGTSTWEWLDPPPSDDLFDQYLASMDSIDAALKQGLNAVIRTVKSGQQIGELSFRHMPSGPKEAALSALQAWRDLKGQSDAEKLLPSTSLIRDILAFIGFTFEAQTRLPITPENHGRDWVHFRVQMTASEQHCRPIPHFGSRAGGRYHVVCVWERPNTDTLTAWLHDLRLETESVIVIYLGRLIKQRRRTLAKISRERDLAIAVLDETLLVYLAWAGINAARLFAFLKCALPYTAVNPYTPFQAGDVPPEMFFGREAMARELERREGSCLVYGGRQLGKSALLRHVQRRFHHVERQRYSWVEDIKQVGAVGGPPGSSLLRLLRDRFKKHKLLSERISTDKPDDICRHIRGVFEQHPDCRVLVLFDEADKFLENEARNQFETVERLRQLMVDTQRRFKVVFAGLQNVQRFQGLPNQPLAHFGSPVALGPLEPEDAQLLVREPFEALGYRFETNSLVLRILSYTNYHPGLIQLYCQELLRYLYDRGTRAHPLYPITHAEVEAVYRRYDVRNNIRDRFDWTLALDSRYQAIAWTMVLEQMEMRDSFARAFDTSEILNRVRGWWPKGFSETKNDELRGLLEEMCGLGVLVRADSGHRYRLRSPNLVRLMGTENDIMSRFAELENRYPPQDFEADEHHIPLDQKAQSFSPLTYRQSRDLAAPQSGVYLVFSCPASGSHRLAEALEGVYSGPDSQTKIQEIQNSILMPMPGKTYVKLSTWLQRLQERQTHYSEVVAYRILGKKHARQLEGIVKVSLEAVLKNAKSSGATKVVLGFDVDAAWEWMLIRDRRRLENRVDVVTTIERWTPEGIRQRFARHEMMHNPSICQEAFNSTQGWHFLVEELFTRCRTDDPRPALREIKGKLETPDSPLSKEFLQHLGLSPSATPYLVLRVAVQLTRDLGSRVPTELLAAEVQEQYPDLPAEEVIAAIEFLERMTMVAVSDVIEASLLTTEIEVDPIICSAMPAGQA